MQNTDAWFQLPTSLKMPSDQRDQSTMAVFAPPQVAWGLPYATKDVAEIVEGPIPDEGHGVRQQSREDADHVRHHCRTRSRLLSIVVSTPQASVSAARTLLRCYPSRALQIPNRAKALCNGRDVPVGAVWPIGLVGAACAGCSCQQLRRCCFIDA